MKSRSEVIKVMVAVYPDDLLAQSQR